MLESEYPGSSVSWKIAPPPVLCRLTLFHYWLALPLACFYIYYYRLPTQHSSRFLPLPLLSLAFSFNYVICCKLFKQFSIVISVFNTLQLTRITTYYSFLL